MGQQHRTGRRAAPCPVTGDCAEALDIRTAWPATGRVGAVSSAGEAGGTALPWPDPADGARSC